MSQFCRGLTPGGSSSFACIAAGVGIGPDSDRFSSSTSSSTSIDIPNSSINALVLSLSVSHDILMTRGLLHSSSVLRFLQRSVYPNDQNLLNINNTYQIQHT